MRKYYLNNITLEDAKRMLLDNFNDFFNDNRVEKVKVINSYGRITSKAVFANISSPHYNSSAVDGVVVKSEKTLSANDRNPIRLKLHFDFEYIDTGDYISDKYDSVIMIEDILEIDDEIIEIRNPVLPWQNIRPVGEDIIANEMIVTSNHKIKSFDIASMLAGGVLDIECYKKPRVGIIASGSEIIEPTDKPKIGQIIDTNSRMFENLVFENGALAKRYEIVKDDYEKIKSLVKKAVLENDVVILGAGSSAGTEDYSAKVIKELGELIFHGVAIKPGKPAILGKVYGKPILGLPGFPVSSFVVFDSFVKEIINRMLGNLRKDNTVKAIISKRLFSSLKHDEFIRVKLGEVSDKLIATPLKRGAAITMSLVRADGYFIIPKSREVIEASEEVEITLLKDITDIENTIISVGSHDIILDIISDMLSKNQSSIYLSSAHVGSLGGIMALRKKECHMATSHLLDIDSGKYNEKYIKQFLKNQKVYLIKGIKRIQGFYVNKESDLKINDIFDVKKFHFVNRQNGSGTRVLFDYILKENGIKKEEILGYTREVNTHTSVASAVLSNKKTTGMGIKSVANIMNLDFIPIRSEDYDFIISEEFYETEKFRNFFEILNSNEFKEKLLKYGGYELENIKVYSISKDSQIELVK